MAAAQREGRARPAAPPPPQCGKTLAELSPPIPGPLSRDSKVVAHCSSLLTQISPWALLCIQVYPSPVF